MNIKKSAIAGTMESSDVQVSVEPRNSGREIVIHSSVLNQYGKQIKSTIIKTLDDLGVENVSISVVDKGALDCTLQARIECAIFRACEIKNNFPWGGIIK